MLNFKSILAFTFYSTFLFLSFDGEAKGGNEVEKHVSEYSKGLKLAQELSTKGSKAVGEKDYKKAFQFFEQSGKALNDPESMAGFSMIAVADFSFTGIGGVKKDRVRACSILYAIIENGIAIQKRGLGTVMAQRAQRFWNKYNGELSPQEYDLVVKRANKILESNFKFF